MPGLFQQDGEVWGSVCFCRTGFVYLFIYCKFILQKVRVDIKKKKRKKFFWQCNHSLSSSFFLGHLDPTGSEWISKMAQGGCSPMSPSAVLGAHPPGVRGGVAAGGSQWATDAIAGCAAPASTGGPPGCGDPALLWQRWPPAPPEGPVTPRAPA